MFNLLFMINDTPICKTYTIRFEIFLALLQILSLLHAITTCIINSIQYIEKKINDNNNKTLSIVFNGACW